MVVITSRRNRLKKSTRLLSAKQFQHVSSKGEKKVGRCLIIHHLQQPSGPKLGITVSRHFGKAHERNRFKRLVRESFRLIQETLPSYHLNIKPRSDARQASLQMIQDELRALLQ